MKKKIPGAAILIATIALFLTFARLTIFTPWAVIFTFFACVAGFGLMYHITK